MNERLESGPSVPNTRGLVGISDIRAAASRLAGVSVRTPLLPVRYGDRTVWLKCESLQPTGAFKLRGAYNFISRLLPAERGRGVITYSSGNHAQAVAYAAREFDVPAGVVMPVDAPVSKLEATRRFGATVELCGTLSTERETRARDLAASSGAVIVPPFDHPDIIAGQGTVGLEIAEQFSGLGPAAAHSGDPAGEQADARPGAGDNSSRRDRAPLVLVPIGGGGLVSGVSAALQALCPEAVVVGVEPEGAPSMQASLAAGGPTELERVDTIADGLKPVSPGALTYRHCRELVDQVVTVGDDEIRQGVRWCFANRLVVEPSGAAGVAALLGDRIPSAYAGRTVVIVISGGNIGWQRLQELLSEPSAEAD